MRIEIRFVTGKLVALKAVVNSFALEASDHAAVRMLTGAVPASDAIGLTEVLQQSLELRIIFKDRQELREPLCIDIERS